MKNASLGRINISIISLTFLNVSSSIMALKLCIAGLQSLFFLSPPFIWEGIEKKEHNIVLRVNIKGNNY